MPVAKAKSRNQAVDRLTDSSTPLSERPEVYGGRDSQFLPTSLKNFELAKIMQNPPERPLTSDTLKNLAKNQIGQSEALPPKLTIKVIGLAILEPMKIIDPHRSIDDHHRRYFGSRPRRELFRSPSHRTFPRSRPMVVCARVCIRSRNPASTTARFVRDLLLRIACCIKRSSMSMLVLIVFLGPSNV
jgi:hypothetical protein